MNIAISEAPITSVDELGVVPITFTVDREYDVAKNQGSGEFVLSERLVEAPYVKDYDGIPGEGPSQWAGRFIFRDGGSSGPSRAAESLAVPFWHSTPAMLRFSRVVPI